jgi:hypothetical protein
MAVLRDRLGDDALTVSTPVALAMMLVRAAVVPAPGRARAALEQSPWSPRLDSESRPDPTFLRRTTRPQTITRPPKRPPPEQPVTTPATRK